MNDYVLVSSGGLIYKFYIDNGMLQKKVLTVEDYDSLNRDRLYTLDDSLADIDYLEMLFARGSMLGHSLVEMPNSPHYGKRILNKYSKEEVI